MQNGELIVFAGNSNKQLSEEIAKKLGLSLGKCELKRFSDGETALVIKESVRGKDAFVIQSTCAPVNDNLIDLLVFIDALKRSSARRITAVIPYFGYARQDKMVEKREPITAKLVANLIEKAGCKRIMTMDLHSGSIQGFFDKPCDNLSAKTLLIKEIQEKKLSDLVIVAPDAGAAKQATKIAKELNAETAIVNKSRPKPNEVTEQTQLIGEIENKNAVIFDDLIDTAGTLCLAAKLLKENGAKKIFACATHGVFSGPAIQRINESVIEEVIVTNTIPLNGKQSPKIKCISIAPLLAEAINRTNKEESISELF